MESNYWIGLSDFAHEGTWRWQESHQEPSYTNWATGQPSNGVVNGDEDCASKGCSITPNCKWNDAPCDSTDALCQMDK